MSDEPKEILGLKVEFTRGTLPAESPPKITMSEKRRCCTKGCAAIRHGYRPDDGWYKVSYGFMYHACPEHAEQWQAFDQAQKTIGKQRGEKFAADHARWEARWNARADRTMPLPTPPELQNSWEISE